MQRREEREFKEEEEEEKREFKGEEAETKVERFSLVLVFIRYSGKSGEKKDKRKIKEKSSDIFQEQSKVPVKGMMRRMKRSMKEGEESYRASKTSAVEVIINTRFTILHIEI